MTNKNEARAEKPTEKPPAIASVAPAEMSARVELQSPLTDTGARVDWRQIDGSARMLETTFAWAQLTSVPVHGPARDAEMAAHQMFAEFGLTPDPQPLERLGEITETFSPRDSTERTAVVVFRNFLMCRGVEALRKYDDLTETIGFLRQIRDLPVERAQRLVADRFAAQARERFEAVEPSAEAAEQPSRTDAFSSPVVGDAAVRWRLAVRGLISNLQRLELQREEFRKTDPDAYTAVGLREIFRHVETLRRGEPIIRVPYVTEKMEEIRRAMETRGMAFVQGDTGAGKSEVCKAFIREFTKMEPVVLRGYPGMDAGEMYGQRRLTSSSSHKIEEIPGLIEAAIAAYDEKNPQVTGEALKKRREAHQAIAAAIVSENGVTVTEYVDGAVYLAAREGRILLIEEANLIPPALMAQLNDLLTLRKGDRVQVQGSDGESFILPERIRIIMNGNVKSDSNDTRYRNRQQGDAAMQDRVPSIDYDYLPQALEGRCETHDFESKQLFAIALITALSGQDLHERDGLVTGFHEVLFEDRAIQDLGISTGIGDLGPLLLPETFLDDLWRLSQFAAVTQGVFSRRLGNNDQYSYVNEASPISIKTERVLSPRGLISLVEAWADGGFSKPLDTVLYDLFIKPTGSPLERAYFTQLAKLMRFFQGNDTSSAPDHGGWQETVYRNHAGQVCGHVMKCVGPEEPPPLRLFRTTEILESLYGPVPPRQSYPTPDESIERRSALEARQAETTAALELFANTCHLAYQIAKEHPFLVKNMDPELKEFLELWGQPEKALALFLSKKDVTQEDIRAALGAVLPGNVATLRMLSSAFDH